jgi:long-chain acyl-CoA synthetase
MDSLISNKPDNTQIAESMDSIREKADTWPKILEYNYRKYSDKNLAMRFKHYGIWQRRTWKEYYLEVKYLALGLLSLGFNTGDKVAIIGDNLPQWYCAELAAQANLGISVGMFSDLSPKEIKYIVSHSGARYAIVEDQEQVDKLLEVKEELPALQKIIYWNYKGLSHYHQPILVAYDRILESGEKYAEEHPYIFEENIEKGKAEDICSIIYTSGATEANPKGTVHSFQTVRASAESLLEVDPWREKDNVFSYLPPAWMTEQVFGIGCHLLSAATLNFAEGPETQQQDMREIGPDILFANSLIWGVQAAKTRARILGAKDLKKFALNTFLPFGYKMAAMRLENRQPGIFTRIYNILANFLLFRPLRDSLGLSNIRLCYSTGTVLNPEVIRLFHAFNVPLKSIYQSAETGVLSCSPNDNIRLDTQGVLLNKVDTMITKDGELACRYPGVFLGYYNEPDKTSSVLKDGWVFTGDCISLSDDKQVVFIDRVDNLIKLSTGDKLAPQQIESQLKASPYIRDAWILTDKQQTYAAAVIVINYDNVGKWADRSKITYTTFADLSQKPEIYQLIKQEIVNINETLPEGVRIKKFINLNREFDPDENEITRNRKLKRPFLQNNYGDLVSAMDRGDAQVKIGSGEQVRDGSAGAARTALDIETIKEAS